VKEKGKGGKIKGKMKVKWQTRQRNCMKDKKNGIPRQGKYISGGRGGGTIFADISK
jgi:hypothetical protein